MDKQAQDKEWLVLNQGNKEKLIDLYKWCKIMDYEKTIGALEEQFGTHNLNPKPPTPKTWEDVEKLEGGKISVDSKVINPNGRAWGLNIKYHNKAEATLKLAILIDLGYGGMVSEEEWKDSNVEKWCIIPCNKIDDIQRIVFYFHSDKRFIAFHTEQQAEEFMSYESNCQLVKRYYLM